MDFDAADAVYTLGRLVDRLVSRVLPRRGRGSQHIADLDYSHVVLVHLWEPSYEVSVTFCESG